MINCCCFAGLALHWILSFRNEFSLSGIIVENESGSFSVPVSVKYFLPCGRGCAEAKHNSNAHWWPGDQLILTYPKLFRLIIRYNVFFRMFFWTPWNLWSKLILSLPKREQLSKMPLWTHQYVVHRGVMRLWMNFVYHWNL